jgi:hypothetical protein
MKECIRAMQKSYEAWVWFACRGPRAYHTQRLTPDMHS